MKFDTSKQLEATSARTRLEYLIGKARHIELKQCRIVKVTTIIEEI